VVNIFLKKDFSFSYLVLSLDDLGKNLEKNIHSVMLFLVIKRAEQLAVIALLMHLIKPETVFNMVICLLGAMLGVMVSVQTYYEGISGVFLLVLYCIPHYPIYVLFLWMLKNYNIRRALNQRQLRLLAVAFLVFLIGVIFEGVVSRFFLNEFYQYMVSS
jgi:hypothetical protein